MKSITARISEPLQKNPEMQAIELITNLKNLKTRPESLIKLGKIRH